jgi:SAM-dependent methyltransferase
VSRFLPDSLRNKLRPQREKTRDVAHAPTSPPAEAPAPAATATPPAAEASTRVVHTWCRVCGHDGDFERGTLNILRSFQCSKCKARLRYQGQAAALVRCYSVHGARSLADLVQEPEFQALSVYEPGSVGPLAKFLEEAPTHVRTSYMQGVPGGEVVNGVRCEDLMALTFPDETFDLIVTSDIMEHVRHPYVAFAEIRRVLRPGGRHVFTIPGTYPLREKTYARVDVSGPDDVFLCKPAYHNEYLVYNDFGADMVARLDEIGYETDVMRFDYPDEEATKQVTFSTTRV